MRRLYWDSCIFIYRVQQVAPWHERIALRLDQVAATPYRLVVTDLTRMECRVLPLRQGDDDMRDRYDATFVRPEIERVACTSTVFDLATELRAQQGLKTPDALHLAAALDAGCDEFWTNDDRLEKAAAGRIAIVTFA